MTIYRLAAWIAVAGVALLAGAAVLSHHRDTPDAVDRDRGGSVWGADYFPNTLLVTHEGERVRFFDDLIEGKIVAINFMYTSCPDTCPVQTARMMQVARLLEDRLGEDVFFYSITIEPEHDTQQVLKAFADSWNIPDGWTLLTGDRRDIVHLRQKLGMRLDDVRTGNLADHSVNFLIGNQKTGRWMKRSPFENPHFLASQIGDWLHEFRLPGEKDLDYENVPEIRQISDGEYIYRNRCAACHTIGGGDLHDVEARHVGPDLFNVTRLRDREWLERWIAEPDAMLEEGDPLALALYEQYQRIPMPNMRLSEKDVTSILGYIERESLRIEAVRAGKIEDHRGQGEHAAHGEHGPDAHGSDAHGSKAHGQAGAAGREGDGDRPHAEGHARHGEHPRHGEHSSHAGTL